MDDGGTPYDRLVTTHPAVDITYEHQHVSGRAVAIVRAFVVIPLLLWAVVWSIWALWSIIIAFVIVFKGRNPNWFWEPVSRWYRYFLHVAGYASLLVEEHPGRKSQTDYPLDVQVTHAAVQSRWLAGGRILLNAPLGTVIALLLLVDVALGILQFTALALMGRRSERIMRWQLGVLTFEYRLIAFGIGLSDAMPFSGARHLP